MHSFTWLLNETYQPSFIYERNRCAHNIHVLAAGKGNVFSYDPDPHLPTVYTIYTHGIPHRPSYTLCIPTYVYPH